MDESYHPNRRLSGAEEPPLLPALFAGLGAALVGGIAWTAIMAVSGYEIGFAAWAMGGIVGFAMSRSTTRRGPIAGAAAAGMALIGLIIAKALIAEFVLVGLGVSEVTSSEELMVQAVALDLQLSEGFPEDIQAAYAAVPEGDTISDALWDRMMEAASSELATMEEADREAVAEQFLVAALGQSSFVERITAQFGAYDALWVLLAVSTAWGMMKKEEAGGLAPDDPETEAV